MIVLAHVRLTRAVVVGSRVILHGAWYGCSLSKEFAQWLFEVLCCHKQSPEEPACVGLTPDFVPLLLPDLVLQLSLLKICLQHKLSKSEASEKGLDPKDSSFSGFTHG